MESPGFGVVGDSPKISADGSKLLFRTQSQSALPGGFAGDTAWVLRDRINSQNTLVMPTVMNRDLIHPDEAVFLPDNSVAFTELGWWQPLAPDQQASLFNIYLSQVFRWDANTHDYTNLSLGPDGQPIGVLPPGAFPASGAVARDPGPRHPVGHPRRPLSLLHDQSPPRPRRPSLAVRAETGIGSEGPVPPGPADR